jgi:hypothetical protein
LCFKIEDSTRKQFAFEEENMEKKKDGSGVPIKKRRNIVHGFHSTPDLKRFQIKGV